MARFFFGAAVWGRLRLRDIPDWGRLGTHHIVFWDETYIDGVSRLALAGEKVRSMAELDEAIASSFDMPGIRPLWIHEDLLPELERRWDQPRKTVKNRWKVRGPAVIAAATAAALVTGLMASGEVRPSHGPLLRAERGPAQISSFPSTAAVHRVPAAPVVMRPRAAQSVPRHARHRMRAARRPAYAVSIGTFATTARADRVMHLVRSKGYIAVVVPRGAASQVTTRPYRTRAQAERIVRGLEAAGLHASLTAWGAL
ncbi:MAG TPA: hypothetical protein VKW09_12245 [bacterium]|nr:hypothetical protein [bacterium]